MLVAVGQSQSFNHAREDKKSRNKCPAKRFFSLSLNHIPIARHWPWVQYGTSSAARCGRLPVARTSLSGGNGGIVDTESPVGGERGAVAIERDVLSERLFEDAVVFF